MWRTLMPDRGILDRQVLDFKRRIRTLEQVDQPEQFALEQVLKTDARAAACDIPAVTNLVREHLK